MYSVYHDKLNHVMRQLFERVSIQSCEGMSGKSEENNDRLGRKAIYAFIYPNFMINRFLLYYLSNLFFLIHALAKVLASYRNCFAN